MYEDSGVDDCTRELSEVLDKVKVHARFTKLLGRASNLSTTGLLFPYILAFPRYMSLNCFCLLVNLLHEDGNPDGNFSYRGFTGLRAFTSHPPSIKAQYSNPPKARKKTVGRKRAVTATDKPVPSTQVTRS